MNNQFPTVDEILKTVTDLESRSPGMGFEYLWTHITGENVDELFERLDEKRRHELIDIAVQNPKTDEEWGRYFVPYGAAIPDDLTCEEIANGLCGMKDTYRRATQSVRSHMKRKGIPCERKDPRSLPKLEMTRAEILDCFPNKYDELVAEYILGWQKKSEGRKILWFPPGSDEPKELPRTFHGQGDQWKLWERLCNTHPWRSEDTDGPRWADLMIVHRQSPRRHCQNPFDNSRSGSLLVVMREKDNAAIPNYDHLGNLHLLDAIRAADAELLDAIGSGKNFAIPGPMFIVKALLLAKIDQQEMEERRLKGGLK